MIARLRRLSLCLSLATALPLSAQQMTTRDLLALKQPNPDSVIHYGADSVQIGELFLPKPSAGRRPVAVLIHGGCWLSAFNRGHIRQLARAIADRGVVVWSIEYRRVGDPGGGWPGSFEDVGAGVDYVRQLAGGFALDTTRMVVSGHSAGGHWALWVGSRGRLPAGTPGAKAPLVPRAILALAAVPDLGEVAASPNPVCGDAISRLIGGSPSDQAERYQVASPARHLPLGIEQVVLTGDADRIVPPDLSRAYVTKAKAAGDRVRLVLAPNAGHFEVVTPGTPAGAQVVDLIVELARPR